MTIDEVTETIKKECEEPRQLLVYRTMYRKTRQVHGLNITRNQVYAAMTVVDPDRLENRKPKLNKKKRIVHFPLLVLTGFFQWALIF